MENLMEKLYGLPAMSIEEERNLPENKKRTMENKISIIDKPGLMLKAVDQIRYRAQRTNLLDDKKHADQVAEWEQMVLEAESLLWKIAQFGIE